jgi:hypothetical protein
MILLASVVLSDPVWAEQRTIDAPITAVTVYPGQAKITRVAELELPAGEHELVVKGLPMSVIDQSIRGSARGTEGITFLGLKYRTEHHLTAPQENVSKLRSQISTAEHNDKQRLIDRHCTRGNWHLCIR